MQHLCGEPFCLFLFTTDSNTYPDEVLQLIFYELPDPSALTLVARRFHRFAQDPYVRAHYFLTHYGPTEAMYYALGRGKLITERVLDVRSPVSHTHTCHATLVAAFSPSFLRLDSPVKRRSPLPISDSNCNSPLFPYSSSFHQDSMGSQRTPPRLRLLS